MEKRKSYRYESVEKLKGKLYNVVNFNVKNISYEGINIICGFITKIGTIYNIYLAKNEEKKDFKIKIIRSEAQPFEDKHEDLSSKGMLYNVGAEFVDLNEERKEFLKYIINDENNLDGALLID